MMEIELSTNQPPVFEQIKRQDEYGNDFWSARDMAKVLKYSEFRHFKPVIERAREACSNSGNQVADHFEDILDMVPIGSGAERKVEDVKLSRQMLMIVVMPTILGNCLFRLARFI